ncbi:hypothetical protein FB446DRAFT_602019, partial [Lentinula raphanica]
QQWFPDAFAYLNVALGERWIELLTSWIQFERVSEWVKAPTKGPRALAATHRPRQLSRWITNCRYSRTGNEPAFEERSLRRFVDEFWHWWTSLQPEWRGLGQGNKPAAVLSYGDDWKSLNIPGKNGWLSVLVCLKWWGLYVMEHDAEGQMQWLIAVEDVHMMLKGL